MRLMSNVCTGEKLIKIKTESFVKHKIYTKPSHFCLTSVYQVICCFCKFCRHNVNWEHVDTCKDRLQSKAQGHFQARYKRCAPHHLASVAPEQFGTDAVLMRSAEQSSEPQSPFRQTAADLLSVWVWDDRIESPPRAHFLQLQLGVTKPSSPLCLISVGLSADRHMFAGKHWISGGLLLSASLRLSILDCL